MRLWWPCKPRQRKETRHAARWAGTLHVLAFPAHAAGRGAAVTAASSLFLSHAGYLSSYEDIASTSRPIPALAADGRPLSLRDALLPLLEECLPGRSGSGSGGGGELAASVAAPASPAAAVQSLPGTPVARSSSAGEDGGGGGSATPAAQASASTDAELPPAPEASEGQPSGTDGDEASSSMAAAGATAGIPAAAAAAGMEGSGAPAGEAAAQLEQAAADGRLLVAGVTPPLDTPLAWLHAQLHAPDCFLYIVVHLPLAR